jgi:hypothetical protein
MKSFTRIGLPILVVVAAVFGITFVRVYSPDEPGQGGGPKPRAAKSAGKDVLTFPIVTVAPTTGKPDSGRESLALWDPEIEVGAPGHFEFWAHNNHAEAVTARVFDVNCQCAEVEVTLVDRGAFRDYAAVSALAGSPLCPAPGPLAALAHAAFSQRLQWAPLLANAERHDQTIPGADPSLGSQLAIFRLGWSGKAEPGPKPIKAFLLAGTGDGQPTGYTLEVTTMVVPAFDPIRRDGTNGWAPVRELSLGELRENGEAKREVYLLSTTRRQLVFRLSVDQSDPCLTWTEPLPASAQELKALSEFVEKNGGTTRRPKSLYKFEVSLRERTPAESGAQRQFHQLDLGLLDRRLTVEAIGAGNHGLPVKARVLGDIDFLSGAPDGRLDLGDSFPADQDRIKDVVLVADRPGLGLTLSTAETTPNYLKAKLDPLEQIDGRNKWRLRVTVPKGKLVGALPPPSAVILTTSGPNPRKLRIPVRGVAYDSGGPRI